MEDVDSRVQPRRISALRLIELLDLLLKYGENAAGRIAGLEPVSEWVLKEIVLCAFFVRFQGIIENRFEVGRCGSSVSMRHKGEVRGG
jgi:hypothetical protein